MALYEVKFAVYNDRNHSSYDPNLWNSVQHVQASNSIQAQALVEAQYGGCAQVHSVTEVR